MRRRNQAIWPQEHAARAKAVAPEEHCLTSPGIRRARLAKKTSQRVDVPWQRLFVDWMRFQLLYLGAVDDNSRHPPAAVEVDLNNHVQIIRVAAAAFRMASSSAAARSLSLFSGSATR